MNQTEQYQIKALRDEVQVLKDMCIKADIKIQELRMRINELEGI